MQMEGANSPPEFSGLRLFVQGLLTDGRVLVSPLPPAPEDSADVFPLLAVMDSVARTELAGDGPAFSQSSALWAARLLHDLCRFVVCRDIGEAAVAAACQVPCPEPRSASVDWSADLCLRNLPGVFRLARLLSNGDPLVAQIKRLAAAWPLSSVGIPGIGPANVHTFIADSALRRLYADRILAAEDASRLGNERLDDLLRGDLGCHRKLAPMLAGKLFAQPAPDAEIGNAS
jgi:hypothetical protein